MLPAGLVTFCEIVDPLGISAVTLRRRVRLSSEHVSRRLWSQRLDPKRRDQGDSLPVYHACRRRFEAWWPEIAGTDPPVTDEHGACCAERAGPSFFCSVFANSEQWSP